jgi:hypothetical protein
VSLADNPIFLTQKRLTHRAGVLAAVLIAALIGLSLLSGLIAYLAAPLDFDFRSSREAGKLFYGWVIGVEVLVLILGGFGKISRVLADDRKAGLWESNRLTPLKPEEIVAGYWLGAALREFYMGLVLAGIGLVIVLLAKLPVTLWLGTQALIIGAALFFGLLALLAGMAVHKAALSCCCRSFSCRCFRLCSPGTRSLTFCCRSMASEICSAPGSIRTRIGAPGRNFLECRCRPSP